jgi:hypothetical protein
MVAAACLLAGCSSDSLRDQNYGSDLAQGYRFPDGGYHYQLDTRQAEPADGGAADEDAAAGDGGSPDAGADAGTGG